jgi:hypothetical protein
VLRFQQDRGGGTQGVRRRLARWKEGNADSSGRFASKVADTASQVSKAAGAIAEGVRSLAEDVGYLSQYAGPLATATARGVMNAVSDPRFLKNLALEVGSRAGDLYLAIGEMIGAIDNPVAQAAAIPPFVAGTSLKMAFGAGLMSDYGSAGSATRQADKDVAEYMKSNNKPEDKKKKVRNFLEKQILGFIAFEKALEHPKNVEKAKENKEENKKAKLLGHAAFGGFCGGMLALTAIKNGLMSAAPATSIPAILIPAIGASLFKGLDKDTSANLKEFLQKWQKEEKAAREDGVSEEKIQKQSLDFMKKFFALGKGAVDKTVDAAIGA